MSEDVECENNINYKAIACEQIPELFLDKIVAKKYFSRFGKIRRFILRPKRLSCIVEYENKDDAERAHTEAGNFNGIDFIVNYAEYEVAHVQNTEEWVDPDVQSELAAMAQGQRIGANLRSSMSVLVQPLQQKAGTFNRFSKTEFLPAATPIPNKVLMLGRVDSPQPEIWKIDIGVRNELEAILKRPAFTDEDKYRILDARDKLIRLTTVRQTDIKKAVATKGICPDMCPEKERYMREFQRQVSIFEMADQEEGCSSTISHRKAVKEYSRSSADQEVPLSHELRSESVLKLTMLYLMHHIMDLCDDPKTSIGDWFHFVWDRTRSIRKDITQQELCSLGAVQLVEQCARFHIHCAARLVAEDPSVFDKIINAENLTKCLQTLKYMYHDLRIKGIHCPCEAEFRSYIILLNLGDSNFLWEVKQLPEYIQKSFEIEQAIAFCNALQNNNYVRFFSMIKSTQTSYLSACILLGYFTRLRIRAMDAIIKSHNWRKNDVYLPLSYLTRVLGFDDELSAASFFNYYGLQCDVLDNRVLLDRLNKPDIEYAMDRALQLVESKRQVSIGECIFGETLPSASVLELHQPHNSFDTNGILKIESWTAEDQLRREAVGKENTSINQHQQELRDTNQALNTETNVFKIPQSSGIISHKQQRQHQNIQIEQKIDSTSQNIASEILSKKQEVTKNSFAGGFKFPGNIFGETSNIVNTIIKPPTTTIKIGEKQNTFLNTSSSQIPEMKVGNIFGGRVINTESSYTNILGAVAKETVNVFQKQSDIGKEMFKKDNVFKNFQSNFEKSIEFKSNMGNTLTNCIAKRILCTENERDQKDAQIRDEKATIEELEEKLQKERQEQQDEEKRQYEKQRIDQIKTILCVKSQQKTENLIIEIIDEEVSKIAQTELGTYQMFNQASDLQKDLLISEVVQTFVEDIAHEEYALMRYDKLLLNRYFSRWLLHVRKKKEQRKLIENTPLWVTTESRAEFAKSLEHPCQNENLGMMKRYRLGQPCDFNELLNVENFILYEENQNPLNLFALVGQHLLIKRKFTPCGLLQQRVYFKFLITLPKDEEELVGFESFSNKWLKRYIERAQIETGPFIHGIEHNVALCVRKLSGIIPKNEQSDEMTTEGDHNDGVICFISGVEIKNHSRKRLYNLLKLTKNHRRVPLAIIAYNCSCNKEDLAEMLDLDFLQEKGLIHSYKILGCRTKQKHFSFRKKLIAAIDFITEQSYLTNYKEIRALAMQNVLPFLETSLGEELWKRWSDSAKRNPVFNKICSIPEYVAGIFHKALDHLLHITQEDFSEMPEFPEELKEFVPINNFSNIPLGLEFFPINWKDKKGTGIIKNFLEDLYTPTMDDVPTDIEGFKFWLLTYASQCVKEDDLAATKASHEAITCFVNQLSQQNLHNIELNLRMKMINYLYVLKPIIFARIKNSLEHFEEELRKLSVIYLKDEFHNYQTQPWWLNYQPLNLVTFDYNEKSLNCPLLKVQEKNADISNSLEYIDRIIAKAEETSRKAEESFSKLKHKKLKDYQNSLKTPLKLKRTLDDSLYQFELSKEVGQYDTRFITELTQDIDKSIQKVLNQSSPTKQKRKRLSIKSPNLCSEIDEVIAKAIKLVDKIESLEDRKVRIKKAKQLSTT